MTSSSCLQRHTFPFQDICNCAKSITWQSHQPSRMSSANRVHKHYVNKDNKEWICTLVWLFCIYCTYAQAWNKLICLLPTGEINKYKWTFLVSCHVQCSRVLLILFTLRMGYYLVIDCQPSNHLQCLVSDQLILRGGGYVVFRKK